MIIKYHIWVSRDHAYRGKPKCACECPVALAILEQTPIERIAVSRTYFAVWLDGRVWYPKVPPEVTRYVAAFDAGERFLDPLEFDMIIDTAARP